MVYEREVLVAVVEAVVEGAEGRALRAWVAVGEEGDVGASGGMKSWWLAWCVFGGGGADGRDLEMCLRRTRGGG